MEFSTLVYVLKKILNLMLLLLVLTSMKFEHLAALYIGYVRLATMLNIKIWQQCSIVITNLDGNTLLPNVEIKEWIWWHLTCGCSSQPNGAMR